MAKKLAQSQATSYCNLVTSDSYNREVLKRISLDKAAMSKLVKMMKDLGVSTSTKVKLVQTIVLPAALYACKSCMKRKANNLMIEAFELWTRRRLRRITWSAEMTNESVITQIRPKHSLETVAAISRFKYFAHVRVCGKIFNVGTDKWQ
jgi:hypothetical protein